ncbi:MAG TPA: DUF2169 domain-containing protein [Polyangia bacterium]|nr:DUF2169 domain-containing protein [Polyangia bacterium]
MSENSPTSTARQMSGRDPEGRNILAVLAKATFRLIPNGRVVLADEQLPLNEAIVRDRERRLLQTDTDLYPHKGATDVVLKGHAYADRPVPSFKVSLRVSQAYKSIQVTGDRTCHLSTTGRLVFSPPAPVEKVPLRYDHAYGGEDKAAAAKYGDPYAELARSLPPELAGVQPRHYSYPRNPAGRGYLLEATPAALESLKLPNLEDPLELLSPERLAVGSVDRWPEQPLPQAMDWVSLSWFPRVAFCGFVPAHAPPAKPIAEVQRGHAPADILTAKAVAQKFSPRAANGASLGLQLPYLKGGEEIELLNLHPMAPRLTLRLPTQRPRIWTDGRNGKLKETEPVIHTVLLEPDESRLSVLWRGSAPALRPYMDDELTKMPFRVSWT